MKYLIIFIPVVEQEVVCHAYAVRLHRVALTIVVVPDVACESQRFEVRKEKNKYQYWLLS